MFFFALLRANGRPAKLFSFDHQPVAGQMPIASEGPVVTLTADQFAAWVANQHTLAWIDGKITIVPTDEVWSVPQILVIDRLIAVGKLRDAYAALRLDAPASSLTDAQFNLRTRWNSGSAIQNDNADAIELLTAVGADPNVILAKA